MDAGFSANSLFILALCEGRACSYTFTYALKVVHPKVFLDLGAFSLGAPHPAHVWSSLCWCGPAAALVPSASVMPAGSVACGEHLVADKMRLCPDAFREPYPVPLTVSYSHVICLVGHIIES